MEKFHTIVIGSGAAGLAAAVRLHALGVTDIAIFTEGLKMGTSINTGSDKQTYYKLGMYGSEPDSPQMMARDLAAGGAVHGDLALAEAAGSTAAFFHLASLGVPFPHDRWGQYIGYKTDHDPRRRATSAGPYTSRDMCRALIAEVRRREIPVREKHYAVELLVRDSRVGGAIFADGDGNFSAILADNVVFAVGGPGGLYGASVYPKVHTGSIGVALAAGAEARNLAESQFGLASVKFRWNVSGSYMQVLPKLVSTAPDGSDEREFLREYFPALPELYDMVFLKGYQWPFAAGHVPGSSLIDIFTYIETVQRGRRVFLDYRSDPADFDFDALGAETKAYLVRSGATGETPLARLAKLNAPALELYRGHGIDLSREMLEVAVCAQHNNGGLAGNLRWESTNIRHLFPVGEVNGSHGVTRPGGSALNAGQVGAFRAAEYIAAHADERDASADFAGLAEESLQKFALQCELPAQCDWKTERAEFQKRMDAAGAFIRSADAVTDALDGAYRQCGRLSSDGLGGLTPQARIAALTNRQLALAQVYYLESVLMQIDYIGSRGGSLVLSDDGEVLTQLGGAWKIKPENPAYRDYAMTCKRGANGCPELGWEKCRPIPETDGWFETVWREFREGKLYGDDDDL